MQNRCPKCKQKLQGSEFLCPHCGHILGQAVYTPKKRKKEWGIPWRKVQRILGILLLIAALAGVAWGVGQLGPLFVSDTVPTEAPTTAPPMVVYQVKLTADTRSWIKGITVHLCKDGKVLDSAQVDAAGKVSFMAPRWEGYYIRLSNLFPALDYHYGDLEIPFPWGEQNLNFRLKNEPIGYTVKVVDSDGAPVKDVMVEFVWKDGLMVKNALSNAEGLAVAELNYDPDWYVNVRSLPNEYRMLEYHATFESGSFQTELVLNTYQEHGIAPENIFTVKLQDEYGDAVKDQDVIVKVGSMESLHLTTNQEGCVTFTGEKDVPYQVQVKNIPEYSFKTFKFEPGSHELTCTLYLHSPLPRYTYTVTFQDQYGQPLEGISISSALDTSNAAGQVSFTSKQDDPAEVSFKIYPMPAGYRCEDSVYPVYWFPADSRELTVTLYRESALYTISVYYSDLMDYKEPAPGVVFEIDISPSQPEHTYYTLVSGEDGTLQMELPLIYSWNQFNISAKELPEGVEGYYTSQWEFVNNENEHRIIIYLVRYA